MNSSQLLPNLFFLGGGRTGAALAFYFLRKGIPVVSVVEKNPERLSFLKTEFHWKFLDSQIDLQKLSSADIIFLTVRDDHLSEIAGDLSRVEISWRNKLVLHCSGALSALVLSPLQEVGADIGGFHPIYSFSIDPRDNRLLDKVWFNIEGSTDVLRKIEEKFSFLKDRLIHIQQEQKQAFHLACVFYSNFYVALAQIICELQKDGALPSKDLFHILYPLLQSAIDQVLKHGPAGALTGPVKRGDRKTILAHIKYLQEHHPDLLPIYLMLSLRLLSLSHLSSKDQDEFTKLFQEILDTSYKNIKIF